MFCSQTHAMIQHSSHIFLSKIDKKMEKVNDTQLKSSLNNFVKAFNERNE